MHEKTNYFAVKFRTSMESHVVWKKDALTLKKGTGSSFRKTNEEAHVTVDTFSTLYLIGIVLYRVPIFNK